VENRTKKSGSLFSNLRLGVLFAIIMSVTMISITTFLYWITYDKTKKALIQKLESKADSVLDFADVLLESRNEKYFSGLSHEVPQVIQNEVFAKFTEISDGEVFFNQSSKSPMNPNHLAKGEEIKIIEKFEKNPNIKEDKRFVVEDGVEYLLASRALYAEQRCTQCHPTWKDGEVIGAEHVRISTNIFYEDLAENKALLIAQWLLNIALIIGSLLILFKIIVSNRIKRLLEMMKKLSSGDFVLDDFVKSENIDTVNTKNEIDKLFVELASVADNLKPKVREVVVQSKDLAFKTSVLAVHAGKLNSDEKINRLKHFIDDTASSSANLKHASDEFSVVFENRIARRYVIVPPVSAKVTFENGEVLEEVHIFDKSTTGISFYVQNPQEGLSEKITNQKATIHLSSKIDGLTTFNVRIVYCIPSKVENISFCGCAIEQAE